MGVWIDLWRTVEILFYVLIGMMLAFFVFNAWGYARCSMTGWDAAVIELPHGKIYCIFEEAKQFMHPLTGAGR